MEPAHDLRLAEGSELRPSTWASFSSNCALARLSEEVWFVQPPVKAAGYSDKMTYLSPLN